MKKSFFIKFASVTLIICMAIPLFSSCKNAQTADGLIASVTAEKTVGEFIARDTEFTIKTTESSSKDEVKKFIKIYPDSDYTITGSGSEYSLKFKSTLLPDSLYRISSLTNGRTVYEWAFQTAQSFGITNVSLPEKITDKAVKFTFSHDDVNNFEENFSISPAVEGVFSRDKNQWTFTSKEQFMPETTYTVSLKKDVASDKGFSLDEDYSVSFFTPEPTGSFASIVRNSDDYSESYTTDEAPTALIKSRGLKSADVKATVYQFSDYNSYLQAHQKYFSAPDFSKIDELLPALTKNSEFTSKLDEYKSNDYPNSKSGPSQSMLIYPSALPMGYYITRIEIGSAKLYHVFQVSNICAYSLVSGNTLGVWVNDAKTKKQTVDNDVLLDNDYDEITDENGMAIFSLKKDSVGAHYAIISNPSYPNFPLVSYIRISSEYDKNTVLKNYNCAIYTDSDGYAQGSQINVFGIVSPLGGADAAKEATLSYNGHDLTVALDKNGAFNEKITPYSHFSGELTLLLKINDVTAAQKTVKIGSVKDNNPAVFGDVFMNASLNGKTLALSCYNVSSSAGFAKNSQSSDPDYAASDYFGKQLFKGTAADTEYTIEAIRHTLFEKKQNGEYFDFNSKSYKPCYEYRRSDKQTSAAKWSGKTQNGKASIAVNYQNDPTKGIYYSYKITYTNKSGKKTAITIFDGFNKQSGSVYNNSQYTLTFSKTFGLKSGENVSGKLTLGDTAVSTGTVLCGTNRFGLINSKVNAANDISVAFSDKCLPSAIVSGAYFDGSHIYRLNQSTLEAANDQNLLDVNITPDKQVYAKGDVVKLNISVSDQKGSAVSAPVLVCVYDPNKTQYSINGKAFINGAQAAGYSMVDYIKESVSQFSQSRIYNAAGKSKTLNYTTHSGDAPIYYNYAQTDGSGKASVSFTADEDIKIYMCTAAAFSSNKFGMSSVKADLSLESEIDMNIQNEISVYDELKIDLSSKSTSDSANGANQPKSTSQSTTDKSNTTQKNETKTAEKCDFTVYLYKAGGNEPEFSEKTLVQKISQEISPSQNRQINFGKLSVGKYAVRLEYSVSDVKRTLTRFINVTDTKLKILPTIGEINKTAQLNNSENTVTAMIYSDEYMRVFNLAKQAYSGTAENLPDALANSAAGSLFGVKNSANIKKYQNDGLCYEKGGSDNLLLSAAAVGISSNGLDTDRLCEYFENRLNDDDITEKIIALWGLGALHKPVLSRLYSYKNQLMKLNDAQRLYLALALAYSGDFNSANSLFEDIAAANEDYAGGSIKTKGLSDDDSTALTALLAMKLNKPIGDKLAEYISSDEFSLKNNHLQSVCIAEYISDYVVSSPGSAKVEIIAYDKNKSKTFKKSDFLKVEIKSEDISQTEFTSSTKLNICAIYLLSE